MDDFVRVRLVRAEQLDLTVFEFDYDMSFVVFFLNADKTIYGRYGTRSDFIESEREISLAGLREAMTTALDWHQRFEELRPSLAAKRNKTPEYSTYGDIPLAPRSRYSRSYGTTSRCVHCHDLRTALQLSYRKQSRPIPDSILFAWPMPDVIGLQFDPKQRATIKGIVPDTPASRAGLQVGDQIQRVNSQPVLSIADVQWVLQKLEPKQAQLKLDITRDQAERTVTITLPNGWRKNTNIAWRSTTRVLRQKVLGGIEYRPVSDAARADLKLKPNQLALRAYRGVSRRSQGPVRRDDVIVELEGRTDSMLEADLIAYILQHKQAGESLSAIVIRDGQRVETEIPIEF